MFYQTTGYEAFGIRKCPWCVGLFTNNSYYYPDRDIKACRGCLKLPDKFKDDETYD